MLWAYFVNIKYMLIKINKNINDFIFYIFISEKFKSPTPTQVCNIS